MVLLDRLCGGILTGHEIRRQIRKGNIVIENYDEANLNPNSYNMAIGDTVTMYKHVDVIDLKDPSTYSEIEQLRIDPDEGLVLRPGCLYLVATQDRIHSPKYEPIPTGRSSIGRLGIAVHQEAGFGDIGFSGNWTLQVKVTYPTRIYPGLKLAQMYFLTPHGRIARLYHGNYQGSNGPTASRWSIKSA